MIKVCALLSAVLGASGMRKLGAQEKSSGYSRTVAPMTKELIPEGQYEGGKCMSGTQAGYFYRAGSTNVWVIFLKGGGACHSKSSCDEWASTHYVDKWQTKVDWGPKGSSKDWPETMPGSGTYSADPVTNPVFHDAHHIYMPYCTGDTYAGQVAEIDVVSSEWGNYYFDGHLNIEAMLAHLHATKPAFANLERLLFTGTSAGGKGVLHNCDFVADSVVQKVGRNVKVNCAPMAGWFLPGFTADNPDPEAIPTPWAYWSAGQLEPTATSDPNAPHKPYYPPACTAALTKTDEPWRCSSATVMYPTIKQPIFVIQDTYDSYQINTLLGLPKADRKTCKGHKFIAYFGEAQRNSTALVKGGKPSDGLFLTSCDSHGSSATLGGYTKYQALDAWFIGNSSVPRISEDTCDMPSPGLPCGSGGRCGLITPIDGCDTGGGDPCQDSLISLCSGKPCLSCAQTNGPALRAAGCSRDRVIELCNLVR